MDEIARMQKEITTCDLKSRPNHQQRFAIINKNVSYT
jgi:hypothetical protein